MATLTETAYITRKVLNLGVILIIAGILLRIVLGGAAQVWRQFFPPPPPAATMIFGPLPQPLAQNNIATPAGGLSYSLETPDGGLPGMPATLRVYFLPRQTSSFGSFDRMKSIASGLNFAEVPLRISSTAWRFTNKSNPLRVLDIDEISQNFRLTYNYLSDQSLFNDKNFNSSDRVVADAQSFFDGLGIMPVEFKTGSPIVSYFQFDAGALVPTTALANADAISVTLTRGNIDSGDKTLGKISVVSPDFRQGLVSVLFAGTSDSQKRILEARFLVAPLDYENFGTYSPISSGEAWNRLKSGRAIFASLPSPMSNTISIRKVYPAYLDPYPAQSYLQPVMVFSDEKGFIAYVPLVATQ